MVSGGSADMGMGMSPFSQQGQPSQSTSWPDTMMGIEGNRSVQHSLMVCIDMFLADLM